MSDYKIQSILNGHSGCKIYLMEDENKQYFVRKFSKDINYNDRLRMQCEKQKNFHHLMIHTPKVIHSNFNDEGLLYFDMEYIHGITLAEYIKRIEVSEIREIVDILTSQIENFNYKNTKNDSDVFINKIEDLYEKIDDPMMCRGLNILSNYNWNNFPHTFCHGDLTLENIIICQGNFYFIDFLDSFYDCFILDIATLLQDVQCMWYYRFETNLEINTKIRLIIFRDLLLKKMSMYNISKKDIYCALLLKLIRIYPYTRENNTVRFLKMNVESIINLLETM